MPIVVFMEPIHDMVQARPRNGARRALLITATLLSVTGIVATQLVQSVPSAAALMASTKDFTDSHESARFSGTMRMEMGDRNAGLGSSMQMAMRMSGEIQDETHMRFTMNMGDDGTNEVIVFGEKVYYRDAETAKELEAALWSTDDTGWMMAGPDDMANPDLAKLLEASNTSTPPSARNVEGGKRELTFSIDPKKFYESMDEEQPSEDDEGALESMVVTVVLDHDDVPVSMQQVMKGDDVTVTADFTFSDWGKDFKITEPSADQIDQTPEFNEEALAEYKDLTVLMPASPPAGWTMSYLDTVEDDECSGVELDYESSDEDSGYLYLYFVPADCISDEGEPFTAGARQGTIEEDEGTYWAELPISATTALQADTDLTPAELANVLSTLVPFDRSRVPASVETTQEAVAPHLVVSGSDS